MPPNLPLAVIENQVAGYWKIKEKAVGNSGVHTDRSKRHSIVVGECTKGIFVREEQTYVKWGNFQKQIAQWRTLFAWC